MIVCTQIDGKSGLVHNHILVNNVSMADGIVPGGIPIGEGRFQDVLVPAGRGCIDQQTYFSYVKKHTNEIAVKYIDLDFGKKQKTKSTQAERTNRGQGKYVWKDDLRERIERAQAEATDLDDFLSRLPAYGVTGTQRTSKKRGDYILYELTDTSGFGPDGKIPPNLKSKSYKLGDAYGLDQLFAKQRQEDREDAARPGSSGPSLAPVAKRPEPDPEKERRRAAAARKAELERQWAARREQAIRDGQRMMGSKEHDVRDKAYES